MIHVGTVGPTVFRLCSLYGWAVGGHDAGGGGLGKACQKNPKVLVCPRGGPWVGEQVSPQDQILANEEEEEKFS